MTLVTTLLVSTSGTKSEFKNSVVAAGTANLTVTYDNGASGFGATLTNAGAQAAFSLDGVSPSAGERVLIKNQTTQTQNGIYTVTVVGSGSVNWVLTRATDFDEADEIESGVIVPVDSGGTANGGTSWLCTSDVNTIGTDNVTFIQYTINPTDVCTLSTAQTLTGQKTFTRGQIIDGGTDEIQQRIQGNATQTSSLIVWEQSDGTDLFTFSNAGVGTLTGQWNVDNLRLDGNTISSTDTNGNINITPDGSGNVVVNGVVAGKLAASVTNTIFSNDGSTTAGVRHTALGYQSLKAATGSANDNTGVGALSLTALTSAVQCTGLGSQALASVTTGNNNIGIGYLSGSGSASGAIALTTGANNVLIGVSSGVNAADAAGCLAIGNSAVANKATGVTSGDDGPSIALGSAAFPVGFRGDATIYPAAGTSSGYWRVKINGTFFKILLFADS